MGTKNNPGEHDCYVTLDPDEPYLLIKARDPAFYGAIDAWVNHRRRSIDLSIIPDNDDERAKIAEAVNLRRQAADWLRANKPERARALGIDSD